MRTVKEISRLTYENGLSRRQVAQSVALARATITDYLRRFEASGLTWPAAAALDDVTLERRLFPSACPDPVPQRPERAGLGEGKPGIAAQGRDADAAVA